MGVAQRSVVMVYGDTISRANQDKMVGRREHPIPPSIDSCIPPVYPYIHPLYPRTPDHPSSLSLRVSLNAGPACDVWSGVLEVVVSPLTPLNAPLIHPSIH